MKTVSLNNIVFRVYDHLDEMPFRIKEKIFRLVSTGGEKYPILGKIAALMLFSSPDLKGFTGFFKKIRLYFAIYLTRRSHHEAILYELSEFFTAFLGKNEVKECPYPWTKKFENLTFFEYRQAINLLYGLENDNKSDNFFKFCELMQVYEPDYEDYEPIMVLSYFNYMMDMCSAAFPNLFQKSGEKPTKNPWAKALSQISESPANMEENDKALVLTVFQFMEEKIIESQRIAEQYDNRK